jgi:hypothetical protein
VVRSKHRAVVAALVSALLVPIVAAVTATPAAAVFVGYVDSIDNDGPGTFAGSLSSSSDNADWYTFQGDVGTEIDVYMTGNYVSYGTDWLDPRVVLFDTPTPAGPGYAIDSDDVLAYDDDSGDGLDAHLVVTLPATGSYLLSAWWPPNDSSGLSGSHRPYAITIGALNGGMISPIDPSVQTFWYDIDADGFGNDDYSTRATSAPEGFVSNRTDCNDTNAAINPASVEVQNEADDNCNGLVDEAISYPDDDGDGFGDATGSVSLETPTPIGYVTNDTDCNDADAAVHPGAQETDNALDDDCDGDVDEGLSAYYPDADGDGFGDEAASGSYALSSPLNHVTDNTDCDDNNSGRYPGAVEIANNGIDENCSDTDLITYYADSDGDTYGNAAEYRDVDGSVPASYVLDDTDCNDDQPAAHPGASEIADDGIDQDCTGADAVRFYRDYDDDGYGGVTTSSVTETGAPIGYVETGTDCDDSAAGVHPGATELQNGTDDNCNGVVDEFFSVTTYTGTGFGYVTNKNATVTFSATVSSSTSSCVTSRAVTFTLNRPPVGKGSSAYVIGTTSTSSAGAAALTVSTSSWKPDTYYVTATTATLGSCAGSTSGPAQLILKIDKASGRR